MIAARLGCSAEAVYNARKRRGIGPYVPPPQPRRAPSLDPEHVDAVAQARREHGWGEHRLHAELGIPVRTIRAIVDLLRERGEDPAASRRQDRDDEIRDLYREGLTSTEIQRRTGYSQGTVIRAIAGMPRIPTRRRQAAIEETLALVDEGLTTDEIARELGRSPITVAADLRRHLDRETASARRRRADDRRATARELYGRVPIEQIAEQLGVSPRTVRGYLRGLLPEPTTAPAMIRHRLTDLQRQRAQQLREQGFTRQQIADRLGLTIGQVKGLLAGTIKPHRSARSR